MAKTKPEGLMDCPECGFHDAEVKLSKSGMLYRYCPDCNAQYFARTPEASGRLAAKMRPVSGTDTGVVVAVVKPAAPVTGTAPAAPVTGTAPAKPATPAGFSMGRL
jgi:predicted  nucleic acid-binding Zn-ribbon protein